MTRANCNLCCAFTPRVAKIDIGSGIDQQFDCRRLPCTRSDHQGGFTLLILHIKVSPGGNQ